MAIMVNFEASENYDWGVACSKEVVVTNYFVGIRWASMIARMQEHAPIYYQSLIVMVVLPGTTHHHLE